MDKIKEPQIVTILRRVVDCPKTSEKERASCLRQIAGYMAAWEKKHPKHVDCCPKSCAVVHEMCELKGCASEGRHFASDHVYVGGRR